MKARQALKIMLQQPENDLPRHKVIPKWRKAWEMHENAVMPSNLPGAINHSIEKAIETTSKLNK